MRQRVFSIAVILGVAGYATFTISFFTDYSMFTDPRWLNLAIGVAGTLVAIMLRP